MSIPVVCECGRAFECPEKDAGWLALCPACGVEVLVPEVARREEILYISGDYDPPETSRLAIASLVFGLLFFLGCLGGIPAIWLGRLALDRINRSEGRIKGRIVAYAGIVLGTFGCLFTCVMPSVLISSPRDAARRAQCVNNLKQIGLAMHNYHSEHEVLPAAAIVDGNGKPLLSWRVAILPYIEQTELYAKFHLDEPWDSPHNIKLLEQMPYVYGCPSDPAAREGLSSYQAVVGCSTPFPPDFTPVRLADITDGTDRTLLVGESKTLVPWTKPVDLSIDPREPLHGLGSHHRSMQDGFNILLVDGSVRFIRSDLDPRLLKALLTASSNDRPPAREF